MTGGLNRIEGSLKLGDYGCNYHIDNSTVPGFRRREDWSSSSSQIEVQCELSTGVKCRKVATPASANRPQSNDEVSVTHFDGVRCIVSLCTSDRRINDTRDVMAKIEDTSYKSMTLGNARVIPAPKNKNDFESDDVRNCVLLRWRTIDDRSIAGAGCTHHRIAPRYQTEIIDLRERSTPVSLAESGAQKGRVDMMLAMEQRLGDLGCAVTVTPCSAPRRYCYPLDPSFIRAARHDDLGQLGSNLVIHSVKFTFYDRTKIFKVYRRNIPVRQT
ncbi:uncharacterized protein F5147DRAFT_656884 [Suillus discolor]|uniref:Uncharacterized protein n=1 Tax=Suillus discolor TaxID=1912936 RepID=A0A9P7JPP2_9AGAM|nr:uncharacterized protein F5147DRAFT_656884 [Suillus discolor]KAG2095468.1 hypothetical protein F5147DRAFT_656884 [Suillus discolor]